MCHESVTYSSGLNIVNVPFAFCFRATVLAFKRNAKWTQERHKLNASISILWDGIYLFTVRSTRVCPISYSRPSVRGVAIRARSSTPFLSLFTRRALRNWAFLSRYSCSQDPVAVCPGPVAGRSSLALHVAVRPVAGCSSLVFT